MEYISAKDIYEIRIASLVSNIDKDVILELYQPLIGSTATILYLTLLKQKRNEDDEEIVFTNENLLSLMQIAPGNLLTARHALEAVGLLRTYEKGNDNNRYYIYVIYAPKNPKEFFDDVLFKGLIIQTIGEKEAKRLAFHYHVDLVIPEEFHEVSASFVDVFNPNYDDASFRKKIDDNLVGHDSGRVNIKFNYDLFFKYVEGNSQITSNAFTKKDMHEIERIATLFGLDEKTMALIIIDEYRGDITPHINFASVAEQAKEQIKHPTLLSKVVVKSKISSDNILAQKIRMMEEKSTAEWLTILQNNTKPARSDLDIANAISKDYGFSSGVINAVIEYVLAKNNNILSRNYCEKICASLARENIQTTVDAMNYLNKNLLLGKKRMASEQTKSNESKENTSSKVISDAEFDNILNELDNLKSKK